MSRKGRLRTLVFLGAVLLVELFYALYHPPYAYPDERSHMQHAAFWRDEGRMPDPYDDVEKVQQDKHPPYLYVLGAVVLRGSASWFERSTTELSLPGPYELSLRLGQPETVRIPPEAPPVLHGQLLVLRGLMVLHWLLGAWFLLKIADFVWGDRPRWAFGLALGCAWIPQVALSGSAFTPDTPLTAFCTASFYFLLVAATGRGKTPRLGLAAGGFLALALLAKSAAVFLIPVALVVAGCRVRAVGQRKEALRFLAWTALLPLLLAGWWYGRNLLLFGDPFQMGAQIEAYTHSVRRDPLTSTFFEALFWDLFRTFFGFYERPVLLPRPVYFALAGLVGVAVTGLLLLLRRPIREEVSPVELRAVPLAVLALGVLLALTIAGNLTVPSAQGRYLYPALGAVLVLLGTGLHVAARVRGDPRATLVLVMLWGLFGLWSFGWAVLRRAGVDRARAAGQGGVVHYEDCGTPGLHPHLVPGQGYESPDEGQLGRIVPWRTLTGHPEAVEYEFPLPELARRGLQVRLTYFNPDPTTPYVAFAQGRFRYTAQRLWVDGQKLHDEIEVTSTPRELVYPLPDELVADGAVRLRFEKTAGIAAIVSEIWIEERWLALELQDGVAVIRNRTERELPCLLRARVDGRDRLFEARLRPGERWRPLAVRAERVAIDLRELSPWIVREAEAHPGEDARWLGDISASGGYRMHGTGVLARLPFGDRPEGALRYLARVGVRRGAWQLRALDPPALGPDDVLEYRSPANAAASIDFVLLSGGWRP